MPNVQKDPPNIAVEFVSAGKRNRQRDYVDKRNEYMTAGLDEYWIIDRFRRMMTAVRRGQPDLVIGETEVYRTTLLPGFELPLAQLLAVADAIDRA
jgi:Uma2 family endonuclease